MIHHLKQTGMNTLTHIPALLNNEKTQKFGLATLIWGMIAACCWLLAYWTWFFITPTTTPPLAANHQANNSALSVEPITQAHLFGVSDTPASSVATAQTLSALGYKLRGVFAGEGKKGVAAIISIGLKDQAFTLGSIVSPGITLSHVYADYVELSHNGVLERLDLERTTQTSGLIVMTPPAAPIAPPPQANSPPTPEALNALVGQQGRRLLGMRP